MKEKVYFYYLKYDSGLAPCLTDDSFLSLACCKGGKRGGMRKSIGNSLIQHGFDKVWVIGLAGKFLCSAPENRDKYNHVVYAMAIQKENIVSVQDYATLPAYKQRKDCLYTRIPGRTGDDIDCFDWSDPTSNVHNNPDAKTRDFNGAYVLITSQFSYWGKNCPDILGKETELIKNISRTPRGYRIIENESDVHIIKSYFLPFIGKAGDPFTPLRASSSICTCCEDTAEYENEDPDIDMKRTSRKKIVCGC
jgi:hypothetical protein